MSIEVKVPQLPESVSDATLVAWHKGEGERVERDENLVDLETDKVVLEVPAPRAGVLSEIRVGDGTTVTTGEVLALLEEGEGGGEAAGAAAGGAGRSGDGEAAAAAGSAGRGEQPAEPGARGGGDTRAAGDGAAGSTPGDGAGEEEDDAAEREAGGAGSGAHRLSPSVRRLVEQHDLDPRDIRGGGRGGRLTKGDVLEYMRRDEEGGPGEGAPEPLMAGDTARGRNDRRVPMTRLRARIAERLVDAQQTAAMLTTFNEIDLAELMALRARHKDAFEKQHGVKLGFMSFFVKAAVEALRQFPVVNASVEETDIIYHDYYDIGIAVSTDRGLLVPVLRDASELSFGDIEKAIADFGERARKGQITMEELTGGTFTITNGGVFGSLLSTPILNPPQSGILGMHKIQQRPMVVDGEIRVRPVMYTALTYDHRIVDGRDAVQFLVSLKNSLEDPARLLLQIRSGQRSTASRSRASMTGRTTTAAGRSAGPA